MCSFKSIYFLIFIIIVFRTNGEISDKRLCIDAECTEPVSHAKTLIRYSSPDARILSFVPNADVVIYSKEAGSDTSLWGAEINGKRGYIPKHLVRELRMIKKPSLLVDTEIANQTTPQVPVVISDNNNNNKVEPQKVKEQFEVVDGTTIYLNAQDAIKPSSTTENPVQPTKVPTENEVPTTIEDSLNPKPLQENVHEKPVDSQKAMTDSVFSKLTNWMSEGALNDNEELEEDDEDDLDVEDEDDEDEDELEYSEELKGDQLEDMSKEMSEIKGENVSLKATTDSLEVKNAETNQETNVADNLVNGQGVEATVSSEKVSDALPSEQQSLKNDSIISDEQKIIDVNTETPEAAENKPENSIVSEKNDKMQELEILGDEKKVINGTLNEEVRLEQPKVEDKEIVPPQTVTEVPFFEENLPFDVYEEVTANPADVVEENQSKPTLEEVLEPVRDQQEVVSESDAIVNATEKPTNQEAVEDNLSPGSEDLKSLPPTQPLAGLFNKNVEVPINSEENVSENVEPSTLPPLGLFSQPQQSVVEETKPDVIEIVEVAKPDVIEVVEEAIPDVIENNLVIQENIGNALKSDEVKRDEDETETTSQDSIIIQNHSEDKVQIDQVPYSVEAEIQETTERTVEEPVEKSQRLFSGVFGLFGGGAEPEVNLDEQQPTDVTPPESSYPEEANVVDNFWSSAKEANSNRDGYCDNQEDVSFLGFIRFNSDVFLYLVTTAISVVLFLFGYIVLDKSKREGPLVARINMLEKQLLVLLKENEIMQERANVGFGDQAIGTVSNEIVQELNQQLAEMQIAKSALEDQVQVLEKELDTSTEVGMELNRILSEMLNSANGDDTLKANVEQLQRQLVEQQDTINTVNETLNLKETENHELNMELEISNKKVTDLQNELDKMVDKILRIEEERDQQQSTLEAEVAMFQERYELSSRKEGELNSELQVLRNKLHEAERTIEVRIKEYNVLKESLKEIQSVKNNNDLMKSLLNVSAVKAELQQLKLENKQYVERLQQEQEAKDVYQKTAQAAAEEAKVFRGKYEEADKNKVEISTKLEVLISYFKEKEAQLQKDLSKYEALWAAKEGEATSTTERIKYMQEELQNYKAQNETLKEEIISQEVELKSKISMLEKKVYDNWVTARQTERKCQDAQHEAAQLRNRLTMRERALAEKSHNRLTLTSPIDQNGDLPLSPHPLDSSASPPLLFGGRDRITKSPPMPLLSPPFLPPPPGPPFMPMPLHGMPPPPMFMPRPPPMFPGDHRPPPLGRMSSPPLTPRYSPDSSAFSPYDRNSPSPPYDSEYESMQAVKRGYSPFNRREYKRAPHVRNGRNTKGSNVSSDRSNDSVENDNRKHPKV